jgi:Holliday junction resolvasome RuvABC endonuclease subunit
MGLLAHRLPAGRHREERRRVRILGIDPSLTSTGVACIDGAATIWARTDRIESKPPKRAKGDKTRATIPERATRIRDISDGVMAWALAGHTSLALIEEPIHGVKGGSIWDRAGLWWSIVSRMQRADIPVVQVNSTTRRIWATGTAGAGKSPVSVHMSRMWPDLDPGLSDDEWDALVFASMGAQHLGWLPVDLARHREQLAKVVWSDVPAGVAA